MYCRRLGSGTSPIEDTELLTDDELAFETLYLGLRTREGVPLETLRRYPDWKSLLERLEAESILRVVGERAVPTIKGFSLADRVAVTFGG